MALNLLLSPAEYGEKNLMAGVGHFAVMLLMLITRFSEDLNTTQQENWDSLIMIQGGFLVATLTANLMGRGLDMSGDYFLPSSITAPFTIGPFLYLENGSVLESAA